MLQCILKSVKLKIKPNYIFKFNCTNRKMNLAAVIDVNKDFRRMYNPPAVNSYYYYLVVFHKYQCNNTYLYNIIYITNHAVSAIN